MKRGLRSLDWALAVSCIIQVAEQVTCIWRVTMMHLTHILKKIVLNTGKAHIIYSIAVNHGHVMVSKFISTKQKVLKKSSQYLVSYSLIQ